MNRSAAATSAAKTSDAVNGPEKARTAPESRKIKRAVSTRIGKSRGITYRTFLLKKLNTVHVTTKKVIRYA